jgi:hypothetical protein
MINWSWRRVSGRSGSVSCRVRWWSFQNCHTFVVHRCSFFVSVAGQAEFESESGHFVALETAGGIAVRAVAMFEYGRNMINALIVPHIGNTEAKDRRWGEDYSVWEGWWEAQGFKSSCEQGLLEPITFCF